MAIFFEDKDRNVIPNWRSFKNTASIGELNITDPSLNRTNSFIPNINDLTEDWKAEKNIGIAGDIISSAIVLNINSEIVKDASNFILKNNDSASAVLINAAKKFITESDNSQKIILDIDTLEAFKEYSNLNLVFQKINSHKKKLISNPKNAIIWVELSRLYAILGNNVKAERAMLNAISLGKDNRFVLRSMVRFFVHNKDIDFAHEILRKNERTKHDHG
jgi:hypothetical protein